MNVLHTIDAGLASYSRQRQQSAITFADAVREALNASDAVSAAYMHGRSEAHIDAAEDRDYEARRALAARLAEMGLSKVEISRLGEVV